jgi:hypothetical protein
MSQPMRVKRIGVGHDVETYCGRCKAERMHTVAAMNSDTEPAEVICRTCNTKHRFRRAGAASAAKQTRARAGGATVPRAGRAAKETPPASARTYTPAETFTEGEWLSHQRYGVGKVNTVRGGKIDVSFGDGPRTLIHAG